MVSELPTPCLLIDRAALERNLTRMARLTREAGKQLRPHAKSHKCSALAKLQAEHGALGICAAKLSEAEALQAGGASGILVTGPIVTEEAHGRLVVLLKKDANVMITLDDLETARRISAAVMEARLSLEVLLDLDAGQQRSGFSQETILAAARELARLPGLRLRGLQAYAGHLQHVVSYEERAEVYRKALEPARTLFLDLKKEHAGVDIFSVGGTGSWEFDLAFPEVTEIQPGSYALMDVEYGTVALGERAGGHFETSLSLLATVVSANQAGFVTIDAGLKSLYRDGGTPEVVRPAGSFIYDWYGDEYGRITLPPGAALHVGEQVALSVSHCDPTVNLFDFFYVIEEGRVAEVWEIDLRGCSQ